MRVVADQATDTGLVRPGNEDSVYCGGTVFVVADGLGGHAAGEIASALAVQPFAELDGDVLPSDLDLARSWLAEGVKQGNRAVIESAQANPERAGMGTTVTATAVVDGQLLVAHVGDSRAYLFRPGEQLWRLTVDHTPPGEAAARGELSLDQADHHPENHMLTRVVGKDPDLAVDIPDPTPLAVGDRLLVCSDGLTAVVDDARIAEVLAADEDPSSLCRRLVEAALAGGGPDNVTVVVARVED